MPSSLDSQPTCSGIQVRPSHQRLLGKDRLIKLYRPDFGLVLQSNNGGDGRYRLLGDNGIRGSPRRCAVVCFGVIVTAIIAAILLRKRAVKRAGA